MTIVDFGDGLLYSQFYSHIWCSLAKCYVARCVRKEDDVRAMVDKTVARFGRLDVAHSGSPAFRSPSVSSVAFDCPPRAIHEEIVKAGSTSRRHDAASRASASRPRWAKADARQRYGSG